MSEPRSVNSRFIRSRTLTGSRPNPVRKSSSHSAKSAIRQAQGILTPETFEDPAGQLHLRNDSHLMALEERSFSLVCEFLVRDTGFLQKLERTRPFAILAARRRGISRIFREELPSPSGRPRLQLRQGDGGRPEAGAQRSRTMAVPIPGAQLPHPLRIRHSQRFF